MNNVNHMQPLPRAIPPELVNEFTMGGKIPVFDWFLDGRASSGPQITYNMDTTEKMIAANRQGVTSFESYPGNRDVLYQILEKNISCVGKDVAVIGTLIPWIEAALLQRGCRSVVTVEYNVLHIEPEVSAKFGWTSVHYSDFCANRQVYDLICTFSSVEHDGLGRYGDPINPSGDFEAMAVIWKKLTPEGRVLWGAPVAADALCWNAHRIYGPIRLPRLLSGFRAEAWITLYSYLSVPATNTAHQPWIILSKTTPNPDADREFEAVHQSILLCPKH